MLLERDANIRDSDGGNQTYRYSYRLIKIEWILQMENKPRDLVIGA